MRIQFRPLPFLTYPSGIIAGHYFHEIYHKIVLSVSRYRIVIHVTETATCGIIVSDKIRCILKSYVSYFQPMRYYKCCLLMQVWVAPRRTGLPPHGEHLVICGPHLTDALSTSLIIIPYVGRRLHVVILVGEGIDRREPTFKSRAFPVMTPPQRCRTKGA